MASPTSRAAVSVRETERRQALLWRIVALGTAFALFGLSRAYSGIIHDSDLYMGRALANADPSGLGRDFFFANDRQFGFSLYPRLIETLLPRLGPATTALALTAAGLTAWFCGAALLASRFATGRTVWACLAFVASLPAQYGAFQVFRFAEQFATPRNLAEGIVLAGLAAMASDRRVLGLAAVLAAALIHPLMALPGLGIWLLMQLARDARWLVAPVLALAALLAGAGLAFPLLDRLFISVDAEWARAISANSYLFPSEWPAQAWSLLVVQAGTIGVASRFAKSGPARLLLRATVLVGLAGLALTVLFADWQTSLLILQLQPWRALWLMAALAALSFPVAAEGLWRSDLTGRVALAGLLFAWLSIGSLPLVSVGVGLAIGAAPLGRRYPGLRTPRMAVACFATVAAYGLLICGQRTILGFLLWTEKPPQASILADLWLNGAFTIPLGVGALVWALGPPRRISALGGSVVAGIILTVLVVSWDNRPGISRRMDVRVPDPALARLVPPADGEILWLRDGGRHVWTLTGRPSWVSYLQGASMIFSRELAVTWTARMDRLVAAELADGGDRDPHRLARHTLRPSRDGIVEFCAAPDAPLAIVVPLDGTIDLPPGLPTERYSLPASSFGVVQENGKLRWRSTSEHAVIACRASRQTGALRGTLPG